MNDLVKGVLGGGWSLVVGWIVPTAVNTLLFALLVLPSLRGVPAFHGLRSATATQVTVAAVTAAVVIGLVLSALQALLYRILEGYIGWPRALHGWCTRRQLRAKKILMDRIDLVRLHRKAENLKETVPQGSLTAEEESRLAALRARQGQARHSIGDRLERRRLRRHRKKQKLDTPGLVRLVELEVARLPGSDHLMTLPQSAVLSERLRRYPVADAQVLPTKLGNAIRRLEEYGFDRYKLDSQVLWYELNAVVGDQARKQVDLARAGVDFFVCLLYGHLIVAAAALAAITASPRHGWILGGGALVLAMFAVLWYRLAGVSTDDWAAATRALLNLGRGPLAESLGLQMPVTLEQERVMWSGASKLSRLPYHQKTADLDEFRTKPPQPDPHPGP